MNFLSFCSVNELFLMTFLAWKPEHMITFLVLISFFLYWDNRLTRLTKDIPGRENGGDVDSGIGITF